MARFGPRAQDHPSWTGRFRVARVRSRASLNRSSLGWEVRKLEVEVLGSGKSSQEKSLRKKEPPLNNYNESIYTCGAEEGRTDVFNGRGTFD
ncbi:hypothetical protein BHE74_00007038 [Ensete ventricosum]|nr:hypothetical protein BHE74_00007038 [Ensete ventricosum]